jgi:hypothetical protein
MLGTVAAHQGRQPHEPSVRDAHRAAAGHRGRGDQAHLPAFAAPQFAHYSFDAGVALRDVQVAARHADPRTTTRYDRARNNLDRHASYIVTAFIAGAS